MTADRAPLIVDWGTSNFRAYRFAGDAIEERRAEAGILKVADGKFAEALRAAIGDWLTPGMEVFLSGMITSRNGWVETPYAFAPATLADLAAKVIERRLDGASLKFLPGVASRAPPDVMRGEEIQVFGATDESEEATVVLPGTHSKWVRIVRGRIEGFTSMMTGETFAVLKNHSILGRLIDPERREHRPDAFARGARLPLGETPGGLLNHIFTARSAALLGELAPEDIADYLSGVLIGHEVRDGLRAAPVGRRVILVGDEALTARYRAALRLAGVAADIGDPRATVAGFRKLAALKR